MSAIGQTLFSALAWGSVALVVAIFAYEIYAVVTDWRGS